MNKEDDPNRRRMMFAAGAILDLEYSLRGVASATQKATYGITMAQRTAGLKKRIAEIQKAAPTDEMAQIITIVNAVALKLNNQAQLTEAADKVAELGKKFTSTETGDKLAGLDPLIPKPEQYRGKPYQP